MTYDPYYKEMGLPNHAPNLVPHAKITRVDLSFCNDGTIVRKWADGWTASTPAISHRVVSPDEKSFEQMIEWLNASGWTVRTWQGGARAWLGKPLPVRTGSQIMSKRRQLQEYPRPGLQLHTLDLALDL